MTAVRLAGFYTALFLVMGVLLPFWPVWLAERGLAASQIAAVVAFGVMIKVVGNPLAAEAADRLGERRRPILALALVAFAGFPLFALTESFWPILAVTILCWGVFPATLPLTESLTMLAVQSGRANYGRVRLWGSVSFIVAAVGAGEVLTGAGVGAVFWMVLAGLAGVVLAAAALPDLRPSRPTAWTRPRLSALVVLRRPGLPLLLAAAGAVQASHAVYYVFATLHWRSVGYTEDVIGMLWAEGVIAEIVLFAYGDRLVHRVGAARLVLIGGLAGVIRWAGTGLYDALPVLLVVQALHAFTYGATHIGTIHLIAGLVPSENSAAAQSLYSSIVMGLALGLTVLAAGPLYAALGGGAFLVMAPLAGIGAGLALAFALKRSDS